MKDELTNKKKKNPLDVGLHNIQFNEVSVKGAESDRRPGNPNQVRLEEERS